MATKAWYKEDRKSFGQFILSEQMRDVTAEVTSDIAKIAAADTPIGEGEDGHMRHKYRTVHQGGVLKVERNLRVMCKVINDDPESALVEFGSRNNKRRRMLGRAGAKMGDFKPDGGAH